MTLGRRLTAEATGTALLLAAVVGSGIMGERLAGGNVAIALLANTLATGAALVALILTFGPISGAHFNPAVSLADASQGGLSWSTAALYVGAQVGGALIGVGLANLMFGEPAFRFSQHVRTGGAEVLIEVVATFGLLSIIWSCSRTRPAAFRSRWAPTSRPPTGSRLRHPSRTRPSRWPGHDKYVRGHSPG
jgi:glycerol uptake facilitator-like aquaporin